MGQAITNAFITYLRDCKASQEPVVLDEVVLANIPNLDPDAPIDQNSGLPAASRIVHRQPVDQRGRINADAVTYSIVMDTTIGDFDFNAMYLINSALGIVGMIVHKGTERKVSSNIDTGKTGNSIVKSMVMSYRGAASATVTTVDASTWQIDYAARLRGMDEDVRLTALRAFGPVSFQGDAFKMSRDGNTIKVQPGVAFVGGLRAQLDEVKTLNPATPWTSVYLDIHRAGSVLDAWVSHFSLRMSQSVLKDYVDGQGYQHYVALVGHLNELGVITDKRIQRQLRINGDAQGSALLDADGDVVVTIQVLDDSHEHTIATIRGLQPALDSKAQVGHTHSPNESGAAPAVHGHAVADIWGLQADLDNKAAANHTHTPSSIGAANANHTHAPSECGAAPQSHKHSVGDIYGLQDELNGLVKKGGLLAGTVQEILAQDTYPTNEVFPVGICTLAEKMDFGEAVASYSPPGSSVSGSILRSVPTRIVNSGTTLTGRLPGTWRSLTPILMKKTDGIIDAPPTLFIRIL